LHRWGELLRLLRLLHRREARLGLLLAGGVGLVGVLLL